MSIGSGAEDPVPTLLPAVPAATGELLDASGELHPKLRGQLDAIGRPATPAALLGRLLPLISRHYELIDEERRGVVRSMQLLAEEARSFAHGLASADAGQLRAILDHVKDVVITVTADGAICLVNPMGEQLFGWSQAELVGVPIRQLLPGLAVQGSTSRGLQLLAGVGTAGTRTAEGRRKDGRNFPVELVASQVRIGRRDTFVLCLRDMSDRLAAERALRASEARFRTLVENAPEAIVVIDRSRGACLDGNGNALRLFGLTRAGLHGLDLAELLHAAPTLPQPAPADDEAELAEGAMSPLPQPFEWRMRDARGEERVTEVRLVPLPGEAALLRASITDVTERRRHQDMVAGERAIFERIASDAPLREVLEAIGALVARVGGEPLVGIARLSADGQRFAEVVGPRLPAALREAEEHNAIDVRNGSSAAAVYFARAVISASVRTDPSWQRQRELATRAGIGAAWAVPVKAPGGRVLGALTVYRAQPGKPREHDLELLVHAARLAAIAIERRDAAEALRESESRFRGLHDTMLEGVFRVGADCRLVSVNPAFVRMLGYDEPAQLLALPDVAALWWDVAARAALLATLERDGEVHNAELRLRRRDGQQVVALASIRLLRDAAGRVLAHEGTLADITARQRAEQAVFDEKERAQVTLASIGDAVITTDRDGRIDYLNPMAEQLSGWSGEEARGQGILSVLRLRDEGTGEPVENPLLRCLREDKAVHFGDHGVLVNRLGQELAIQDSAAPIRDRDGRTVGAVVVFRDVTKERRLRRALSFQASHDALTGLINRREFDNRLQAALESARDGSASHALLYVDLDQFKVVNDTCGHPAGDRLLRDVTALLQQQVRSADVIARLGGDEFGILVQHCDQAQATRIAEGIRAAVRDYRFAWDGHVLSIGASIGVVGIDAGSGSVAAVASAADIACYAAKEGGRNRVHVYDAGASSGRHREMEWASRLTRAIDEDRIELHVQPVIDLAQGQGAALGGRPALLEVLVRLRATAGALVLPGEFLPAAERYGLAGAIDRRVLERAAQWLSGEWDAGREPPLLGLNLSAASLCDRSFLETVRLVCEDERVAGCLCFEISEAALLAVRAQALEFMHELRGRGCRFAVDDFGSGLSSFQLLKSLPVDFLKVDGRFLATGEADAVDQHLLEAVHKVAQALGIVAIGERIEHASAIERLRQAGIGHAQGYGLAEPVPLVMGQPAA